jgi:predicted metal-dependent hydrolase
MQLSFNYNNTTIYFDVTYRKRKTLSIAVEAPDKVSVVAPLGLQEELILERVKSKAPWILKKLQGFKDMSPPSKKRICKWRDFSVPGY